MAKKLEKGPAISNGKGSPEIQTIGNDNIERTYPNAESSDEKFFEEMDKIGVEVDEDYKKDYNNPIKKEDMAAMTQELEKITKNPSDDENPADEEVPIHDDIEDAKESEEAAEKEKIKNDLEEKLNLARKDYAAAFFKKRNTAEFNNKETGEGFQKFQKENYLAALKEYRQELLRQGSSEQEIIIKTVVEEANKLYNDKIDTDLDNRSGSYWKTTTLAAINKYRKLPLKTKLAISGALIGAGVTAAAIGGVMGIALGGAAVTGRYMQRILGGAGTAVALEAAMKKAQDKKEEKATLDILLTDKLDSQIKNDNQALDNQLFELIGNKDKQKLSRYIIAGAAGITTASGLVGKAMHDSGLTDKIGELLGEGAEKAKNFWHSFYQGTPHAGDHPEVFEQSSPQLHQEAGDNIIGDTTVGNDADLPTAETPDIGAAVTEKTIDYTATAGQGDSVWKMVEHKLTEVQGNKFTSLDLAKKTYIIDAIKDKIAANPEKFGLHNIDEIKIGQKIDFSEIIKDKDLMDKITGQADKLTAEQMENIKHYSAGHQAEIKTDANIEQPLAASELNDSNSFRVQKPTAEIIQQVEIESNEPPAGEAIPPPEDILQRHPASIACENHTVKTIGLSNWEYGKIKNMTIREFLDKMPKNGEEYTKIYNDADLRKQLGKTMPHRWLYGQDEFKRQWWLADMIGKCFPSPEEQKSTIAEFLKKIDYHEYFRQYYK